jgi:hypothetical protein
MSCFVSFSPASIISPATRTAFASPTSMTVLPSLEISVAIPSPSSTCPSVWSRSASSIWYMPGASTCCGTRTRITLE